MKIINGQKRKRFCFVTRIAFSMTNFSYENVTLLKLRNHQATDCYGSLVNTTNRDSEEYIQNLGTNTVRYLQKIQTIQEKY